MDRVKRVRSLYSDVVPTQISSQWERAGSARGSSVQPRPMNDLSLDHDPGSLASAQFMLSLASVPSLQCCRFPPSGRHGKGFVSDPLFSTSLLRGVESHESRIDWCKIRVLDPCLFGWKATKTFVIRHIPTSQPSCKNDRRVSTDRITAAL